MVSKLSSTVEHQRAQIEEYVERVGSATIDQTSLTVQIKALEGESPDDNQVWDKYCLGSKSYTFFHTVLLTAVCPTALAGQLKAATSLAAAAATTNGGFATTTGGICWEGPSSHPINVPGHAVALIRTASEISHKMMAVQSEMSSARMRSVEHGAAMRSLEW